MAFEFLDPTASKESNLNPFLTNSSLTIGHLKLYIRMRYPSYKAAGLAAGISSGRVKQLVTGKYLPKTSELINKIAAGWQIDPVKLALLFEKYREAEVKHGETK